MNEHRHTQVQETVAHLAGSFFAREANPTPLITITRADVSPDMKRAIVFLSVLPESGEEQALHFARRQRSAFREYVAKEARLHPLPFFDFLIDEGEKNRQRVDELTR
jgi:ribosome-binding factor A